MGSRERKRAERRKRKQRRALRPEARSSAGNGDSAATGPPESPSERRNREAREALEPLREDERPAVVTVGAVVSGLVTLIFLASAVVAGVGDVEVGGETPDPAPLVLFGLVMAAMTWGMWRARYWAVLGFQTLLVLFLIAAALGLVQATSVLQVIGTVLLIAVCGALFYFMIKAMARIQMPERAPRR